MYHTSFETTNAEKIKSKNNNAKATYGPFMIFQLNIKGLYNIWLV